MAIFKTKDLTYYYPNNSEPAVYQASLEIKEGEMVLLVGPSGCGKSTLLKMFAGLAPKFYGGTIGGHILFKNMDMAKESRSLAPEAAILFQDPEKQIILTDVEREIVFGMENLGLKPEMMKRRLAETLDFMGVRDIVGRRTTELSAGQKQKVALASILAINPEVLLLDEPTSQMDPISAEEILNTIRKIAEDTGKTIVIAEQKLERCLHLVDRVVAMETGMVRFQGDVQEYCRWAIENKSFFLPSIPRLFARVDIERIPLTVKQGRMAINNMNSMKRNPQSIFLPGLGETNKLDSGEGSRGENTVIKIKNLWFSYDGSRDVLKDINLEFKEGEFISILGQNGAGKSTLVKNINGLLKPSRGYIEIEGVATKNKSVAELSKKIGFLGQNPDNYLLNDTVEEEVKYTLSNFKLGWNEHVEEVMDLLGLRPYKGMNPRDLSTGQKQRVALASVLSVGPEILILDEPTRGMDYQRKNDLGRLLLDLKLQGKTIILVTHDVEFAAEFCDRAVIMFNGEIAADGSKRDILKDNLYYSSQVNKLFYGIKEIITFEEALNQFTVDS